MAEISNKQTRPSSPRAPRAGNAKSSENSGGNRNGNVAQRAHNAARNGNQVRGRQDKHLKSYTAPDSESEFRAIHQGSGNRNFNSFSDNLQFNDSRVNGNRARPGNYKRNDNNGNRRNFQNRSAQNGQQWSPSDSSYNPGLHELRGSDWYREDQARYAAQQIAAERNGSDADGDSNPPQQNADGKRANNQRGRQRRRPTTQRNGNPQHANRRNDGNDQQKNGARPARPHHKKYNDPSRSRPGNNNGITPTGSNAGGTASHAADGPAQTGKSTPAATANANAKPVDAAESAPTTQSSESPARDHNKARRAPWRTQKHGTRRKTAGPSTS